MIDISPFPYQGPLEADEVRGREQLVTDLVERVSERRVTALLGPRRYGKTSVLRRVAADVGAGGVSVVWLDLYEVTSMADLAMRLDAALADAVGSFAQRATTTASGLGINLGVLKVELRRSARSRPEPVATTHALLEILVRSATNGPTVVIFDEFSSIGQVRGAAGLLRTALQHHYRTVGLMFAGSRPSMMRTLFSSRSEPFYGQADLLDIGPLPTPALADIVSAGFEETGRSAGGLPARIAAYTGGHPQRGCSSLTQRGAAPPPGRLRRWTSGTWRSPRCASRRRRAWSVCSPVSQVERRRYCA